ncbi:MAG: single-stranded DNA-binding protein [Solirubrobacterales bacterium]
MSNLNTVAITGNLTHDPELRTTGSGSSVCELRVAVNRREKVDGEWSERANYLTVVVWGRAAEVCATHLHKGRGVAVQGHLRWEEWSDREGQRRQSVRIVADPSGVEFLGASGAPTGEAKEVSASGTQAPSHPEGTSSEVSHANGSGQAPDQSPERLPF